MPEQRRRRHRPAHRSSRGAWTRSWDRRRPPGRVARPTCRIRSRCESARLPGLSAPRCASSRATAALHVFMPPVRYLEDYLDLIAAIEDTAAELGLPVIIEGYTPPRRPAAERAQGHARPGRDRGEHPSGRVWDELVAQHHALYEEARADPPGHREVHARRPAHRHRRRQSHRRSAGRRRRTARFCAGPICCAAWSATGTIIPRCRTCSAACSSAPPARRRAWTRRATIALRTGDRLPADPGPRAHCPPWLVDRVFRNLLVDVTGNTHRAEFCIDKLYSPERRPDGWAWWSCAPSKCRRTRA